MYSVLGTQLSCPPFNAAKQRTYRSAYLNLHHWVAIYSFPSSGKWCWVCKVKSHLWGLDLIVRYPHGTIRDDTRISSMYVRMLRNDRSRSVYAIRVIRARLFKIVSSYQHKTEDILLRPPYRTYRRFGSRGLVRLYIGIWSI